MRIKEIDIYGYGKWVDQNFKVNQGLQVFLGHNEAGKSTLMSFIHSVLFGFPTRTSKDLRYEPRESSKYGGKIIIEDKRFGEVQIERVHGKVTGDVTVTFEDGTTGSEELLETILYELNQVTFKNIYSFSLTDIENVHQLDKNKLSRYLFTIGALGTEHYLDLVDELEAEANELYRPSGRVRPLNMQLEAIEHQEEELLALEKDNAQYLELLEESKVHQETLNELEFKQKMTEKKLADLLEIKKEWHVVEEVQSLEKELVAIDLPPLKEDGYYLLEEYKKEQEQLAQDLRQIVIHLETQKEKLSNPEMIKTYQENQDLLHQLEDDLPDMVEQLNAIKSLDEKIKRLEADSERLIERLHIQNTTLQPSEFTAAETEIVHNWQSAFEIEQEKLDALDQKMQAFENELTAQHHKLDQLEAVMWSADELEAVEKQLQQTGSQPLEKEKQGNSSLFWVSLVTTGGLFASAFIFEWPVKGLLLLISLLALIFSGILFLKNKGGQKEDWRQADDSSQELLREQISKQQYLKSEWREALSEVDERQFDFERVQADFERAIQMQSSLENNWRNLLLNHQLSDDIPFEKAAEAMEMTNGYLEFVAKIEESKRQQEKLNGELEKQTRGISKLLPEHFDNVADKILAFRSYLRLLKNEVAHEEKKIEKLTQLENEQKQLLQNQRSVNQKLSYLIEMAGVKNEEEFVEQYALKKSYDEKSSRLKFLKENLPDLETSEFSDKEEIEKAEGKARNLLEDIEQESKNVLRAQANTQLTIEKIEKDGTYTEKLQIFENKKAVVQNYVDEWISNKLAAGMIRKTLDQVTEEKFKEIIQEAEKYFELLTDGNYKKISFQKDQLFVINEQGDFVDVRGLSRGTAEPLYVAIRLAYIRHTSDKMDFPLIMDDPFVNFDHGRKVKMYELLREFSHDLQIIYFSFDSDVVSYFNADEIIELNKYE